MQRRDDSLQILIDRSAASFARSKFDVAKLVDDVGFTALAFLFAAQTNTAVIAAWTLAHVVADAAIKGGGGGRGGLTELTNNS